MRITTNREVWLIVLAIDLLAATIVTLAILSLYPAESWRYEITLSLSLVFVIATPTSYFMAQQLKKNHQLASDLQRLVDRDRLTDVATRDFFFNQMAENPDAYGVSLMVDIDKFKEINDTYGHLAGDQVIKCVAQSLHRAVRQNDIVARFGGEEFVVFLQEQNLQTGYAAAEVMRQSIERQTFMFRDLEVRVTVSIGGSIKSACDDIERAIKEADEALYRAKQGGRNQTVFVALQNDRRIRGRSIGPGENDRDVSAVA